MYNVSTTDVDFYICVRLFKFLQHDNEKNILEQKINYFLSNNFDVIFPVLFPLL
jgi:hypothetical protein